MYYFREDEPVRVGEGSFVDSVSMVKSKRILSGGKLHWPERVLFQLAVKDDSTYHRNII